MNTTCPRCQLPLDCSGLQGNVACPRCNQVFSVGEPQPFVVARSSPRSYRRQEPSYFGNSFAITIGIIAALCVIPILICAGLLGLAAVGHSVEQQERNVQRNVRR